jgi:hypothetical protein
VIISLLALLIASVSLIWTFANQWEQNRKWEKLNEGNPEIKEIRLLNWKELSKEEAMNIQWGYDPSIYGKGEASDRFVVPYYLSLRDANTNVLVPNTNPVFTLPEIEQELKRIDFKGKVIVYRLFKPKFEIENMGKTEIKELSINIDAKLPNQEWNRAFTSNAKINLTGSQKSTVFFSFEIPVEIILPEQISFKVHFNYLNYKNKKTEKIIGAKWTTNDNFWSYETITE